MLDIDDPTMNRKSATNQERGEKVMKKRKDKRATAERKRTNKRETSKQ